MKYLPILLILFVSCSPQKRIQRLTEKHPELIPVKEKVIQKDSTVYKETVREVPVFIEGDTTYIDVPIDCPDQDVADFETSRLRQQIKILNNRLQTVTTYKADTVFIPVKDTESVNRSDTSTKTIQPVKYIPKLYKIALWACIGLIFGVIIWVVIKLKF